MPEPTPTYNSSTLEDMFLEEISELLNKTFSGCKQELTDAMILLKGMGGKRVLLLPCVYWNS